MPPGGDGFRIPIVLDFSKSISNISDFKRAVSRAFTDIESKSRSAQGSGTPLSPKALTGLIGRQAGAAQAAVNTANDLSPEQRQELRRYIDRQVDAQVAAFKRDPHYADLKAPTAKVIDRSRLAEEKRIEAARVRERAAAERAAAAAEQIAAATTRRAATQPPPTPGGSLPGSSGQFAEKFGLDRGIPTEDENEERLRLLRQQQAASPNVFDRLGRQAGIDRIFGLQVGKAEVNDEVFRSPEARQLRLELTLDRRIQELEERSDVERALIGEERQLLRQTAELNVLMERRQLEQRGDRREVAGTDLDDLRAADRLGRERDRGRVTGLVADATTPEIAQELGQSRAAEKARRARLDTVANRELLARQEYVKELADAALARRAETRAVNAAANAQLRAGGQQGTLVQRAQAYIAQRSGGPPREATDYLTGRQLFASRALTTASFAASGALLYGGVQFAKELVTEATALQIQLGIVNSQLQEAGDVGGLSFGTIRSEIIGVSKETGVMANQVALVVRQLAGAFATPEGTPDFARGLEEAQSAFKLGRVTGLPDQEITDSLTAISLAFEKTAEDGTPLQVSFEEIGDTIIGLEQRFGVLAPEIVKFTADLAPLGAELGFTVTQLSALGAVAQQVSGRTGAVLSEQFGRILPALAERSSDLLLLFQQNDKTAAQIPGLSRALAQRDLPAVLEELVIGYEHFSAAQRNSLVSLVGSRREAAAFYAILARGEQTRRALNTTPDEFTGQQGRRFEDFSKTVQFSFEQAQRAIEEFGISLFNAGLADLLAGAGQAAELFFSGLNAVLQPLLELNELTDGWVTKLAALALGLFAVNKALVGMAAAQKAIAASSFGQGLANGSFVGRRAAAAAAPSIPMLGGGALPLGGAGGAAAGGLGAAARGFLGANGPGLIILAGVIGKSIRDQGVEDLSEGVDFLRQQTRQALEKGIDPAEIRRIAEEGQGDLGVFDRVNLFVHGQPTITDVTNREINEFYAALREQQLEAIRVAAEEAGSQPVTRGDQELYNPYEPGEVPDAAVSDADRLTQEFIDRFGEDPHGLADEALEFIDEVEDPALRQALTEMQTKFVEDIKEANRRVRELNAAAGRISSVSGQVSIDELRQEVSSGSKSPDELIARLKTQVDDLNLLIANVRRTREDLTPEEQQALATQLDGLVKNRETLLDEIDKLAEQRITAPADLRIRIRESLNLPSSDEQNLAEIKSVITQLEGINPEEQLERVFQGIELLRSLAEAAEQKTFKIPPEFQVVLAQAQVPAAVSGAEGAAIASALNIGIDALSNRIVAAIAQVGLDGTAITATIIEARRAMLLRAKNAAVQVANFRVRESRLKEIGGDLAALDELQATLNGLVTGIVGGIETGGDTGYVEEKKEDPVDPNILARAIAEGNLAIARAQANGDPIQLAHLAIQAADVMARFAKDEGEALQATAARIEAFNQLRAAESDIGSAWVELLGASTQDNAVVNTQFAQGAAMIAVQQAQGMAAKMRAQAQQVQADRAARDAVRDVFTAHQELLIAIANAAGDTVQAATQQLAIARQNLQNLTSEGGGQAELDRARAEIVNATAAVRDAQFQDQMGDIDFLLEMERISVSQAIQMLQRLAEIPGATEEMIRSIERRIKQLRDDVNGDLNFNLPDIKLPTLYEVRRLMQSGTPAGTGSYQDNRNVQLVVNISQDVDAAPILAEIADMVGAPPTTGTYPGLY